MPGSSAQPRLAKPLKALLASACLLVCASAAHGPPFDADLAASLAAGEQPLSGQTESAMAPDSPPVSRELASRELASREPVSREMALSGIVEGSLEASLARSGASADLSLKLREALSSALDDGNQLHSGD